MKAKKHPKKFRKKSERAEFILAELAAVLDKADANKIQLKMRSGFVCSKYGYVLPFKRGWGVRMLTDTGYPDDEFDDD
jgi:hypothetical protein